MSAPLPRIASVTVAGPTVVDVDWTDGNAIRIDLAGWIATGGEILAPLADAHVFARVGVSEYGAGVTWDADEGDLGIDARHLALLAAEQRPFGPVEAAEWQAAMALSNAEAAELLGVVPSTWSTYKAGSEIPKAITMLCRAMRRDPVLMQAFFRPRKAGRPRRGTAAA